MIFDKGVAAKGCNNTCIQEEVEGVTVAPAGPNSPAVSLSFIQYALKFTICATLALVILVISIVCVVHKHLVLLLMLA